MKRLNIVLILLLFVLTSAFAGFFADVGVGVFTKVGISYDLGKFSYDAGVETSFPVVSFVSGKLFPKLLGDKLSNKDFFKYGSKLYKGIDTGAYYQINDNQKNKFYAGLGIKFAMLDDSARIDLFNLEFSDVYKMLAGAMNIQFKYKHQFDKKNGLFACVGVPVLLYLHTYPEGENMYPATIFTTSYLLYEVSPYVDIKHSAAILYGAFVGATAKIGYSYSL